MPEKCHKNCNGYSGETIDIDSILASVRASAGKHNWTITNLEASPEVSLLALTRFKSENAKNIYISAGVHGDEPAGPVALCNLLEENDFPDENLWICPCLNPTGFAKNQRENIQGIDLNRDYEKLIAAETKVHTDWLSKQPRFDIALMLHEDWEAHGFYLYEERRDPAPALGRKIVEKVKEIFPIDTSHEIDGFPSYDGIVKTGMDCIDFIHKDNPMFPEAIYLYCYKTDLSYTLETGSAYPLADRVAALAKAVKAACEEIL